MTIPRSACLLLMLLIKPVYSFAQIAPAQSNSCATTQSAAEGRPELLFPLKGLSFNDDRDLDPYTVRINAVFDHNVATDKKGNLLIYGCDQAVTTFSGETGKTDPLGTFFHCTGSPQDVLEHGYADSPAHLFFVNSNYTDGTTADREHLYYDGHPGYDFQASIGTQVHAAISGCVSYPEIMAGVKDAKKLHVLAITPDNFPDHRILYLHLSTPQDQQNVVRVPTEDVDPIPGCPGNVDLPLKAGTHVQAGCLIALSGFAGLSDASKAHLHFEVQKCNGLCVSDVQWTLCFRC